MEITKIAVVDEDGISIRLDQYIHKNMLQGESRSFAQRLIDEGVVFVNGKEGASSYKLRLNDEITLTMPEPKSTEILPENIPLNILYEDSEIIVINKPAGMVVHPAAGNIDGTLVNALLWHCKDLSGINGELRPGIVHRIDKGTTGVLVAAKNDHSHNHLAEQFHQHSIKRIYHAIVFGNFDKDSGKIDSLIGRDPADRLKFTTKTATGKRAVTRWKILERYDKIALTELRLETGRTHQIRVHLTENGHPLLGDPVYGDGGRTNSIKDTELKKLISTLGRQALHASVLGFIHPSNNQYIEFRAEMPDDMQQILDYLSGGKNAQ